MAPHGRQGCYPHAGSKRQDLALTAVLDCLRYAEVVGNPLQVYPLQVGSESRHLYLGSEPMVVLLSKLTLSAVKMPSLKEPRLPW